MGWKKLIFFFKFKLRFVLFEIYVMNASYGLIIAGDWVLRVCGVIEGKVKVL